MGRKSSPKSTTHLNGDESLFRWVNENVWLDGCDLRTERRQATEEGRDLAAVTAEFDRLLAVLPPDDSWHQHLGGERDRAWWETAGALVDTIQALPLRAGYPYREPSDLEGILRLRPSARSGKAWKGSRKDHVKHLHGGLLGRICGCMLGKPVETWRRADIRKTAEGTDNWPLRNYLAVPTMAQERRILAAKPGKYLHAECRWPSVVLPHMRGMVEDDDTNYTTTGFVIVKQKGKDFTPLDVAAFWGGHLPIFHTCTAERVAYRNFVNCVLPPRSASYRNPYREWIGAQIRADYFGYANPGNPARAAEWAWRDACISHTKNGIYGAMWVAAMIAAAYVERDGLAIIRAGLAQIPAQSRLAEGVQKIIAAWESNAAYEEVIGRIHDQWDETDHHDWCHTISNAQVVVVALLYGEDDYEKTITRAVMPGFDTDCNGATAGSIWGTIHGVDAIPRKWTRPINDQLRTGVAGYQDVKISRLAEEMTDVAIRNR